MQFRVNIRKLKQVMWLLCAMAFAYCGWTFYEVWTAKQQGEYLARKSPEFEAIFKSRLAEVPAGSSRASYSPESYEALWKALVAKEEAPLAGPDEEVPEVAVKIADIGTVLRVSAVLYSNTPVYRFVALQYLTAGALPVGGKTQRLHLSEGDPLKPPYDEAPYFGKVLRIGQQEVVFSWGGAEVSVTPKLGVDGRGLPIKDWTVDAEQDPAAGITETPEESVQLAPGEWVIGSRDIEKVRVDPQRFLAEELNVRTVTMPKGERTQLEINHVEEGSLAATYGAKKGDRIISVNGIPMSSIAGAINWFKQYSDLPTYVVVFERAGQEQSLTIHVK